MRCIDYLRPQSLLLVALLVTVLALLSLPVLPLHAEEGIFIFLLGTESGVGLMRAAPRSISGT